MAGGSNVERIDVFDRLLLLTEAPPMMIETGHRPVSLVLSFDFHSDHKIQALALQFLTVVSNTRYKGREQDPLLLCPGRSFLYLSS